MRTDAGDAAEIGRLLQEACHDMREPVATVLTLAATALAAPEVPGDARAALEQIITQAEWLADIIGHRLRPAGPTPAHLRPANLISLVNEAVAAQRAAWPGELAVVWPGEPVRSPIDRVSFRRMIANLLTNAVCAAGPAGRVTLEIGCCDGQALVVVEDSGPGFGAVQERFGLGLFSVARTVAAWGGRLECVHRPRGGARVQLWLPLAASTMRGSGACAPSSV